MTWPAPAASQPSGAAQLHVQSPPRSATTVDDTSSVSCPPSVQPPRTGSGRPRSGQLPLQRSALALSSAASSSGATSPLARCALRSSVSACVRASSTLPAGTWYFIRAVGP